MRAVITRTLSRISSAASPGRRRGRVGASLISASVTSSWDQYLPGLPYRPPCP
jgi:hypothetical protein